MNTPPCFCLAVSHGILALALSSFTGCNREQSEPVNAPPSAPGKAWISAWDALQNEPPPAEVAVPGLPLAKDGRIWFRFRPESQPTRVFLAGNFNAWGQNDDGKVSNSRFAMKPNDDGVYTLSIAHDRDDIAYKFVLEDENGNFHWVPDPFVGPGNADGHSLVHLPRERPATAPSAPDARTPVAESATPQLQPSLEKVWVRPGESNVLRVEPTRDPGPGASWKLTVSDVGGAIIHEAEFPARRGINGLPVPAIQREGGYRVDVRLEEPETEPESGWNVLTVANSIGDDLRYGFYATYGEQSGDYDLRSDTLAGLQINAVEFYDYFPAHGRYAPTERFYAFEPFGIKIDAFDVRDKIEAGRRRNILSIAYVAAYAASESVYREFPHPMTTADGVPLIFNGQIMPEDQADREGKPKWFWIMNIAPDSPWHTHVLDEFRRSLDESSDSVVTFDGFEVDTYGDNPEDLFHAPGSAYDGELRRDVLRKFMADVSAMTRKVKPHGLVSFNSVNEFGVEGMYDTTDFLFMEIWKFHADHLAQLTDISRYHRAQRNQRVVLKIYPADAEPKATAFSPLALARVLAACMAGGASLMVAGEPNPETGHPHGLNSLFYPDHTPLPPGSQEVLRAYNLHDALHFGLTHGRNVQNVETAAHLPDCLVTAFAAPDHQALTLRILHYGKEPRWTVDPGPVSPLEDQVLRFPLPGGAEPKQVLFSSPDGMEFDAPKPIPFTVKDGTIEIPLPAIQTLATLTLYY